jgi:type I restriction enzyme S subunit
MGTHDQGPVKGPGFAVGRATNLGVPTWSEGDYWPLNTTLYAADFKGNDPEFLFRLFQRLDLSGFDSGSVQPMLNRNYIAQVKVRLPPLSEQRGIAEVLGALDDKIAANTRFLTTARELVDAELDSALAASAETRTVDDLAAFHNRRRVPLSANQRKERAGDVPYYGAAGPIDTVDVALFDEEIVLVGEDGSVMTERGAPVVQYVWGPSWVNNHAHVLTGSSVSTPFLRVLMERGNVAHLVTGAVQPKLSMGNLKRLELSLPADSTQLQATVDAHAAIERAKKSESRLLAATRNALLPLLMSGKVRVQDAESVVGEVL